MKIHRHYVGLVFLFVGLVVFVGCGEKEPQSSSEQTAQKKTTTPVEQSPKTNNANESAEEILGQMIRAYKKAPGYADLGTVRLKGKGPGQPIDLKHDFKVAFARPNKIALDILEGNEVGNGFIIRGSSAIAPGQVLELPSPSQLTIESLFSDYVLARSMTPGYAENYTWIPIQVVLLLADDPLKTLLYGVSETHLLKPSKIGIHDCYRVEIARPDGKGIFWIDKETFILRRFEYPVDAINNMMRAENGSELSIVADFTNARFESPDDPKAFQYAVSPGTKTTSQLLPIDVDSLGKRSKDFIFVGLDNKPVTLNSLSGKVAVILFWSIGDPVSRKVMKHIGPLYNRFKNNPKVRLLPVNIDPINLTNTDLKSMVAQLGLDLPIYRDSERHAIAAFGNMAPPMAVLLGPKGIVQAHYDVNRLLASTELQNSIDQLLAGQNVYDKGQEAFQNMVDEYHRLFAEMVTRDLFTSPMNVQQELFRASTAEKSEPSVMRLNSLWTSDLIEAPGNLLPVVERDGSLHILVSAGREVAELDAQGHVIARHNLMLPPGEFITYVRTAVDRDGHRWYAVAAPGSQQLHVFDETWKPVMSFPPQMPDEPHAGIGDVRLADLEGDGTVEACIGYHGLVGVKGVSLDGKVLWSRRSLANIFKMAVGSPMPDGRRFLFCTNNQYTLASLDGGGNVVGQIEIPNRLLYWIAAADLNGDRQTELCGLSANLQGGNTAMGLTPGGKFLWKYDLPQGLPGPYVELVIPAWLKPNGPGQWILVGADGSLHVVSDMGKPLDQFNYGQPILGVAFAQIDGKPALLITTDGKVEAYSVAWPGG